jgi:CPA1 family monovalent cation:H+ antiporter
LRWIHVLNWGGLRGAISLALALSLPATLGADREVVRVMAFGVVLFTLLVQGTTMRPLLRKLRIGVADPVQTEYEMRHARLMAYRAAATHLDKMHRDGFLSEHAWELLRPELLARTQTLAVAVRDLLRINPALAGEELGRARRELLRAQRSALLRLQRDGIISEAVYETLVSEIDLGLVGEAEDQVAQSTGLEEPEAESNAG